MNMNLEELHCYIENNENNICGIAAMKGGVLRYSDCWHGYLPTDTTHVMSVTKSVVSLLIGIAIDRGLIKSVDQPVMDFFPEYTIKRGEKTIQTVTIGHLLSMTAPYKYRSEPWTRICTSDNWTYATLDILGGRDAVGKFRYSTLGIHVLTGILAATSGMKTVDFANKYLFEPIGVAPHSEFFAKTAQEHKDFTLSKEPKGDVWFSDPQGVATAGYGLCLSAQDMARIGQLCLDGGVCNGKRVVSAEWITESTRVRQICDETFAGMGYGYLWWSPDPEKPAYAALGNSGNAIYINPETETVVSVIGTFKPRIYDRVDFIEKYIEPMI